ncbi:mitochondrial glycoprotein [Pleurotus eryngii]|uniref:Mitochondrial glycoprotein n=1 Tax=Pleurotus eryngii TaxID=5323 RepID=A0A9P6A0P5_PLEER|nr:mitochondrial glycoprotein [Pleurotus eryngii]
MSATRALRQLASVSTRRTFASAPRVVATAFRFVPSASAPVRSFSSSTRRLGEGATDLSITQKLQEELKYEQEAANASPEVPEFLKTFKSQGVWQIEDTAGSDEVALTRKFGNENVRMIFSIADIAAEDEEADFNEGEEAAGQEGEDSEDPLHSYPIRASLSITKTNGPGALNVDMMCQDGHFIIDSISFYRDSQLGTELTAEADWKRRGLYIGPQFESLDVLVQEEFEKFLQERGVNESLALFIPEYAEHKEQLEYVQWLQSVKSFVDL